MEDQSVHVLGDVGEHQFCLGAGKADGADEELDIATSRFNPHNRSQDARSENFADWRGIHVTAHVLLSWIVTSASLIRLFSVLQSARTL